MPDAEFAFDDEAKFSRWPLVVVIVLLTTIVFFVGSIFWLRNRPGGTPATRTEAPLAGAADPDDSQASQGSQPPISTSPAPATATKSSETTTTPSQPDDRAAEPQPTTPTGSTAQPPVTGETAEKPQSDPPRVTSPGATGTTPPVEPPSQPVAPGSVPAASGTAPPAASTEATYSVHVASYQTLKKANVEIANLRTLGYEARAIETDLGSKGMWYRVYAGSYPTAAEAARAREVLLRLPDYSFAQVRRLPRP